MAIYLTTTKEEMVEREKIRKHFIDNQSNIKEVEKQSVKYGFKYKFIESGVQIQYKDKGYFIYNNEIENYNWSNII